MAGSSKIFNYFQITTTILALMLNSFLIYVVKNYTQQRIGPYKYLIIIYSVYEMIYALVVGVGLPINYITEKSWLVFNHDGLIGGTAFNWLGPTLYCAFCQIWMGLVVVHFIYRYIVVCRHDLKMKIEETVRWKIGLASVYAIHVLYTIACAFYYCSQSEMSEKIQAHIREDFGVQEPEKIGFLLLRLKTLEGDWNPGGIIAILNHYLIVLVSVIIISFCGLNVWITIRKMQKGNIMKTVVNLERQMFFTLLIQMSIPLIFCHLPVFIYLVGTSPFISDDFTFGSASSAFTSLTAAPKVLDPIVVMYFIREYRLAVLIILNLQRGPSIGTVSNSTADGTKHTNGSQNIGH